MVWFLRNRVQQIEFFVILDHFFFFWPPLTAQKIKILKKWKKCLEISFYTSKQKIMIICYTVPEIRCVTDVIFSFHLELFFALLPPNNPKNHLEISFYTCEPKIMITWCTVLWYSPQRMDGRTDRKSGT